MSPLNPDGTTSREIIGSVAEGLRANSADAEMMARFKQIFTDPGLQMISFTITEKGYALYRPDGSLMPVVQADIDEGPAHARHAMSMVAALLLERFQNGAAPLAVVSMDNCSHNGEKLQASVMTVAKAWLEKGYVGQDFIDYLSDESKITFPWSMIDKITPRPHKMVEESLEKDGIEGMAPIVTSKNTFIAAFVNAERPQYLVVEDKFPNGRPALEKAGVYLTDRETVNKTERMKVTTCLNPLHTAMSVYGCMLGYDLICAEMKDEDIVAPSSSAWAMSRACRSSLTRRSWPPRPSLTRSSSSACPTPSCPTRRSASQPIPPRRSASASARPSRATSPRAAT